jgi:GTP-binding protein
MRREGYELAISRPEVIVKDIDGEQCEPYEAVTLDVDEEHQGKIMEQLGERKGELKDMISDGKGRCRLDYVIATRGLIGFHSEFLTLTSGSGLFYHVFSHYGPMQAGIANERKNGVLIAKCSGASRAFALFNLQNRGKLFVSPQTDCYEGMVVGIHVRDNDLTVNVTKEKQLTNVRASGSDENIILTPALNYSLEDALEFINDDELVEVTPQTIRIRKKFLLEHERKKASREKGE